MRKYWRKSLQNLLLWFSATLQEASAQPALLYTNLTGMGIWFVKVIPLPKL